MKYFLDTSSWIKRYSGENGAEMVDSLIETKNIVVYDLAIVELVSNIYRLKNEGFLSSSEINEIIAAMYNDLKNFEVVRHGLNDVFAFQSICEKQRQTAIDGMILLLAKKINDVVIITSDVRLKDGSMLENIQVEIV
jgi:predicted nucleic acid-binding protein